MRQFIFEGKPDVPVYIPDAMNLPVGGVRLMTNQRARVLRIVIEVEMDHEPAGACIAGLVDEKHEQLFVLPLVDVAAACDCEPPEEKNAKRPADAGREEVV